MQHVLSDRYRAVNYLHRVAGRQRYNFKKHNYLSGTLSFNLAELQSLERMNNSRSSSGIKDHYLEHMSILKRQRDEVDKKATTGRLRSGKTT